MVDETGAPPAPAKVKLGALRADVRAEAEGVWQDIAEVPGLRLRVRGINYPPYVTGRRLVTQRLFRKYPGTKAVPSDVDDAETGKLYAQHLLLEWDGIEEIYSPELALETLSDPAQRLMRGFVAWASSQVGGAAIEDDALGNSNGGSAGSSDQAAKSSGSNA